LHRKQRHNFCCEGQKFGGVRLHLGACLDWDFAIVIHHPSGSTSQCDLTTQVDQLHNIHVLFHHFLTITFTLTITNSTSPLTI
jgi:hypothetical protein